jgi:crossover junction endodeoxyribonuclease RuvC
VIKVAKTKGSKREYLLAVMRDLVLGFAAAYDVGLIAMEKVHSMPKQGVSSMFTMGEGVGVWKMLLVCSRLPHEFVTPQAWKKVIGLPVKAEKGDAIIKAGQLFPDAAPFLARKKDDGRADALLIAEWARRRSLGLIQQAA